MGLGGRRHRRSRAPTTSLDWLYQYHGVFERKEVFGLDKVFWCKAPKGGDVADYIPGQPLSRQLSRKYAMGVRKFELGIWCCKDLNLIKAVYLTTWSEAKQTQGKHKGESKNSRNYFMQDLRELKRRLIAEGIVYESCFCLEDSSKSNLIHAHGFMRLLKTISSADLHNIISRIWGDVHDSPIVWVKDVYAVENVVKYILKDAVKNYVSAGRSGGRLLCSKGWLPLGWKEVQKILWNWCSSVKYPEWVKTPEDVFNFELENEKSGVNWEYVYLAKEIMKDLVFRWCHGEEITIDFNGVRTIIQSENIFEQDLNNG
jgi:hypothetical protein